MSKEYSLPQGGKSNEYIKVADSNASRAQAEPAGHTNTLKFQPQMPPEFKSKRQATRIP
jgi:hypothetical protein